MEVPKPRGFFASLFDLSFEEFITMKIIKILYILEMILGGLGLIFLIVMMALTNIGLLIITLIFSPLIYLIWLILARIWLEGVVVIFKVAENTGETVRLLGRERRE